MYTRIYVLKNLAFDKLLKMLKISSMLAIDLETRDSERSNQTIDNEEDDKKHYQTVYVGYLIEHIVPGVLPHIEPLILLRQAVHVHKRQLLLGYSGVKILGLGSFRVGRTSKGMPMVEVTEQHLLAHLDLRGRRLVVDDNYVSKHAREIAYWFTPIAMITGLHRWGLSWRRIVASAIAVAWRYGVIPRHDVEAIATSFVEYAYNRLRYNIYGEERYMVPEALKYIERLQEAIREAVGVTYYVESPLEFLMDTLDGLIDEVEKVIQEEVKALKNMLDRLDMGRGRKYWNLLGVYKDGLSSLVEALKEISVIKNNALLLVPSETWSPLYLATLIELMKRKNIDELKVVLGYTPQTLPQIIFSIEVLKDCGVKIKRESGESERTDQLPKIMLTMKKHGDKKVGLTLYMVPLIAKTPTIAYQQLKVIKEKIRVEKLVYIPKHVALAPTIASLKKLEQMNEAIALQPTSSE